MTVGQLVDQLTDGEDFGAYLDGARLIPEFKIRDVLKEDEIVHIIASPKVKSYVAPGDGLKRTKARNSRRSKRRRQMSGGSQAGESLDSANSSSLSETTSDNDSTGLQLDNDSASASASQTKWQKEDKDAMWESKVEESNGSMILNAIECKNPDIFRPTVPPFPYERQPPRIVIKPPPVGQLELEDGTRFFDIMPQVVDSIQLKPNMVVFVTYTGCHNWRPETFDHIAWIESVDTATDNIQFTVESSHCPSDVQWVYDGSIADCQFWVIDSDYKGTIPNPEFAYERRDIISHIQGCNVSTS
jgi:hypothetical protein